MTPDPNARQSGRPPIHAILRESRSLATLGLPIVISMASAMLIAVVDTIMVAPLGTVPLAAVSITSTMAVVFYAGLYGFVSAIGVRMAEAHGARDAVALSRATKVGMVMAGVIGTLGAGAMLLAKPALGAMGQPPEVLAILDGYWFFMSLLLIPFTLFYALKGLFDAIDAPWIGVWLGFFAVILNVPANFVLIHGVGAWDGLGLTGAGLASLISQSAPLLVALYLWRRARLAAAARHPVTADRKEMRMQMREGTIIAVGYIGEGGAYAVVALAMGWFGAAALAAEQIVNSVGSVLYMVPLGVAIAVSIRVGQAIGAEERHRLHQIGLAALVTIIAWMSLVMVLVLVFGGAIAAALSDDPAVVTLAASFFVVIAMMQIGDGVQGTMLGAARGMMDNRVPVTITMGCFWLIAVPLGVVLGWELEMGPVWVWIGYSIGAFLAALGVTWRFFAKAAA